jgi:hypothetical protein
MNTFNSAMTQTARTARVDRRFFLAALACAAIATSTHVAVAKEAAADASNDGLAPSIVIHSPETSAPISGPVRIEVTFVPAGNVPIDPASVKVSYGAFGIDITDRVRHYAKIDERGIIAELPSMPKGKHTFDIRISDVLKRSSHIRVKCEVAG